MQAIHRRLARPQQGPPLPLTLLISIGAFLISLHPLGLCSPPLQIILPPVLAALSTRVISVFRHGEDFTLVRLAIPPPSEFIRGLFTGITERFRVLVLVCLAIGIGNTLAPLIWGSSFGRITPWYQAMIVFVLFLADSSIRILTWGLWLAICVGVGILFGLKTNNQESATALSMIIVVLGTLTAMIYRTTISAMLNIIAGLINNALPPNIGFRQPTVQIFPNLVILGMAIIVVGILWFSLIRIARRL